MTLAQLMSLIDTEAAQRGGATPAQEAEFSEWAELGPSREVA